MRTGPLSGPAPHFPRRGRHVLVPGLRGAARRRSCPEAWSLVLLIFRATVVTCRVAFAKLRVPPLPPAAALITSTIGFLLLSTSATTTAVLNPTPAARRWGRDSQPGHLRRVFQVMLPSESGRAAATTSVLIDLGLGGGPVLLGLGAAAID